MYNINYYTESNLHICMDVLLLNFSRHPQQRAKAFYIFFLRVKARAASKKRKVSCVTR